MQAFSAQNTHVIRDYCHKHAKCCMNFTHLREDGWCAQTVLELPPTLAHKNYADRTLPPERLHPFRDVFQSPFSSEGEPDAGSPVWRASEARRAKARSPRVNEGHEGRSERPVGQHRAPPSVTTGCGVACYCKGRGPCSPAAMAWSVSGRRRHSAAKTRAARVSAVSPGSTGTAAWASTRPLS